jgi:peptidoglycan/LPS O-acetylase OafA/YrhL
VTTTPSIVAERSQPRLALLDGLRLVAALMVVMFHYVASERWAWEASGRQLFPTLHRVFAYGAMGVELFFMISGFVICMSAWGRPVGTFFVSRVTRLYPAYWFAVLIVFGFGFFVPEFRQSLSVTLLNLTMLQDGLRAPRMDGVYWTLWVELTFYVLFSIVVWRGLTYRRVVTFCALWTLASVIAIHSGSELLNLIVEPQYSRYFIAGIAFYLMYRFGQNMLLWSIVVAQWLLAVYGLAGRLHDLAPVADKHFNWWAGTGLVTAFFLSIAAIALGWLPAVRWRWLSVAGLLTYPTYLLHKVGVVAFDRWHTQVNRYVLLVGTIAAVLVLAWLTHRWVERPVSRLLKRGLSSAMQDIRAHSAPTEARAHNAPTEARRPVAAAEPQPRRTRPTVPAPTRHPSGLPVRQIRDE